MNKNKSFKNANKNEYKFELEDKAERKAKFIDKRQARKSKQKILRPQEEICE